MLTVGGLFSGIGGWELGLERAGMEIVWHCESDPFCQRVLERQWPGVPIYPDVLSLRSLDIQRVDVLCGGFPCQDISVAGKGAGLTGSRSGLWAEYARLIAELRPRYALVENVSALRKRGLAQVLADLMACGYDAEWDCLPASSFGAPHRRDRLWLVAYPSSDRVREQPGRRDGSSGPRSSLIGNDGSQGALPDANGTRPQGAGLLSSGRQQLGEHGGAELVADTDQVRRRGRSGDLGPGGRGEPADGGWWAAEPDVGRVAHGVPNRVDRLRSLGNALVPQVAEWIGGRILQYERHLETP